MTPYRCEEDVNVLYDSLNDIKRSLTLGPVLRFSIYVCNSTQSDELQSLELWNMAENKCMTMPAHECMISSLAQSPVTGMVASTSHDTSVKIWK